MNKSWFAHSLKLFKLFWKVHWIHDFVFTLCGCLQVALEGGRAVSERKLRRQMHHLCRIYETEPVGASVVCLSPTFLQKAKRLDDWVCAHQISLSLSPSLSQGRVVSSVYPLEHLPSHIVFVSCRQHSYSQYMRRAQTESCHSVEDFFTFKFVIFTFNLFLLNVFP